MNEKMLVMALFSLFQLLFFMLHQPERGMIHRKNILFYLYNPGKVS